MFMPGFSSRKMALMNARVVFVFARADTRVTGLAQDNRRATVYQFTAVHIKGTHCSPYTSSYAIYKLKVCSETFFLQLTRANSNS